MLKGPDIKRFHSFIRKAFGFVTLNVDLEQPTGTSAREQAPKTTLVHDMEAE